MNSSKQIKIGALLSYFSIGFNIIAGLIYTPWMINAIGKSDYGLYTLANSLITMFLIDFGLSAATSRYLSKYKAQNDSVSASKFLGAVYKLYLVIDLVILTVLAVLYFFVDDIYMKLTAAELAKFRVVYIIAAVYAVINFPFVTLNGILTAHEKFIELKVADIVQRVLTIVFTVIALYCGMGLYALVTVTALSGIVVILVKLVIIKRSTDASVHIGRTDKTLYKKIFSFSLWATVTALAARLVINITPSILGIVANSTAIALFGIVTTIEGYTYTITGAINGMFMPRISRIYEEGGDIMPLMIKVGKFQFALNGLIVSGFAVLGYNFILLWMGKDYVSAYLGILLVIIPGLLYNPLQVGTTAMIVKNKVREQALIVLFVGVLNVALSFVLSSRYSLLGACISICVAYTARAILYAVVQYRVMGLDIPRFLKSLARFLWPVIITIAAGAALNKLLPSVSLTAFLVKGVAVVLVYGVGIAVLGLNKTEKNILLNKIKGKMK